MAAPKWGRTKKAVVAVRDFLQQHLKGEKILLGKRLNEALWARGIKNPPHHIEVEAVKDKEGIIRAELVGFVYDEPTAAEREEKKTLETKVEKKKTEVKKEEAEKKEAPKEEKKPVKKKEVTKEEKPKAKKAPAKKAEKKE